MNRSIFLFLFLFTILSVQHGSAEEQLNRPKRGFSIFKFLPSFNIFSKKEEQPVKLEPIYPIWKVHKYNGVQLKPVTLGELSQSLIKKDKIEPPAPTKPQILPSLEQLKLIFGTTSDAETFDALKEVASTRDGLRMVAGFIKANIENAKVLAKSSDEAESKTEQYRYSVPAEDEKHEEFIAVSSEEKSPIEKDSSTIIVSSDQVSSDKEESSQHPFHLGLNYVKSVLGSKPKIFVPPKIFVLPKTHSKQKFIIQPTSTESKSDVFNSSLGDNSNFAASGQSFLPFYGPPKADNKVLDHEKFNSEFFKESSFGSSKKIVSETLGEEYGLPSVEYGSPKFSSNGAFSQKLQNTYGVPQVENLGAVSIPNVPVPHEVYGIPKPESNHFKMENKSQIDTSNRNKTVLKHEKEHIIPFPIIPALPSIPEPEFLTKFHHHGHLPGKSVFSFTGPVAFKSVDSLKKPKIVVSKFEKPGFSYTKLSELPLEEGRRIQKTSGQISSYGDDVSSYVFENDNAPAASSYKPIRVRPSLKKPKMEDDSHKHSHSHSQSQPIAVPTMSPKRRWEPKSKRVYNN